MSLLSSIHHQEMTQENAALGGKDLAAHGNLNRVESLRQNSLFNIRQDSSLIRTVTAAANMKRANGQDNIIMEKDEIDNDSQDKASEKNAIRKNGTSQSSDQLQTGLNADDALYVKRMQSIVVQKVTKIYSGSQRNTFSHATHSESTGQQSPKRGETIYNKNSKLS